MNAELLVLRVVHITCGILWVGSFFFLNAYLLPVLATSGPASAVVIPGLQARKAFTVIPLLALITILAGLRLLMRTSSNFSAAYFASTTGMAYTASAVAAVIGYAIAMLVVRPASMRGGALAAQLAGLPSEASGERERLTGELGGVRRRAKSWGAYATVLLLLATVGMSVARYL